MSSDERVAAYEQRIAELEDFIRKTNIGSNPSTADIFDAWRVLAEQRKERLDNAIRSLHAVALALDAVEFQGEAEVGDPTRFLDRIEELANAGLRLVPPRPVMDALESWLEAEKPDGVEVTSEDVDRNVRWAIVRQWFEAAGGGS